MKRKKNGFISMSLVYTFFMLFVTIMLSLVATYAHNRLLLSAVNDGNIEVIENPEHYKLTLSPINASGVKCSPECGTVFPTEYEVYHGSIRKFILSPGANYTLFPKKPDDIIVTCYDKTRAVVTIPNSYGAGRDPEKPYSDILFIGISNASAYRRERAFMDYNELTEYYGTGSKEATKAMIAEKNEFYFDKDIDCEILFTSVY